MNATAAKSMTNLPKKELSGIETYIALTATYGKCLRVAMTQFVLFDQRDETRLLSSFSTLLSSAAGFISNAALKSQSTTSLFLVSLLQFEEVYE